MRVNTTQKQKAKKRAKKAKKENARKTTERKKRKSFVANTWIAAEWTAFLIRSILDWIDTMCLFSVNGRTTENDNVIDFYVLI